MEAFIIAVIIWLVIYGVYTLIFAGKYATSAGHTKHALDQIYEENRHMDGVRNEMEETLEILKADIDDSITLKILSFLPFGKSMVVNIVKAGLQERASILVLGVLFAMIAGVAYISQSGQNPLWMIAAILLPLWLGYRYVVKRIRKRNDQFIDMFPDVLDMIVRSVRSGFPLNTAISMVAENMEPPISTEFAQVADELAFGRSLGESLERLATRIPEPDIRFFVVVLKIQQDTGGNLAEVITNLSNVIRKRKQLRRKIRAMTSEGRVTGYILSAIPIILFLIILYMSPDHLQPLFDTTTGNIVFAIAVGLIVLAQIVVRKMIDIDI